MFSKLFVGRAKAVRSSVVPQGGGHGFLSVTLAHPFRSYDPQQKHNYNQSSGCVGGVKKQIHGKNVFLFWRRLEQHMGSSQLDNLVNLLSDNQHFTACI